MLKTVEHSRIGLILCGLLALLLSGCMAAQSQAAPAFDILAEARRLPFQGTVEELLEYDPAASLAYTSERGMSYYMGEARRMLDMDGILVYFIDAADRFAEVWFCVPNATSAQYFATLDRLAELTAGDYFVSKIDGEILPLDPAEESELRTNEGAVAPELILESGYADLKEYDGAALGLTLRGADSLLLADFTWKEGGALPEPFTSEMKIHLSFSSEV